MFGWLRVGALLAALLGAACATPSTGPDIQPGARPALNTDEAGLWMVMDRMESDLKGSGRVVKDADLNAYVQRVMCRLTPDHCADIRVYIVRHPGFNASMAPNGMMFVWTGLLLRVENEAQLAFVLGHEVAHYLRRHSLQSWRDQRAKVDALAFIQLAAAAAGVGVVADVARLMLVGSIFAFSREAEREADRVGFAMAVKAGYDPKQAARNWAGIIKEHDAMDDPRPFLFFASHPDPGERQQTLKGMADGLDRGTGLVGRTGRKALWGIIGGMRQRLWREELRLRQFDRAQVLLDRMRESGLSSGELDFYQGELYRLRRKDGDADKAIASYEQAVAAKGAPPEAHRSLGLMYIKAGRRDDARGALKRYLKASPGANDRAMIQSQIEQLE